MNELRVHGIGTQVHYIPVHLQPYYRNKYGYTLGNYLAAEAYYQQCLSLPLFPNLQRWGIGFVSDSVHAQLGEAM